LLGWINLVGLIVRKFRLILGFLLFWFFGGLKIVVEILIKKNNMIWWFIFGFKVGLIFIGLFS
jgi:hypothetical protein